MKGFKWLGIMVAVALIVAMCVVPVSASTAVTTRVNTQELNDWRRRPQSPRRTPRAR